MEPFTIVLGKLSGDTISICLSMDGKRIHLRINDEPFILTVPQAEQIATILIEAANEIRSK